MDRSNMIVKGRVISVTSGGTVVRDLGGQSLTFELKTAHIRVDRVLAGDPWQEIDVEFLANPEIPLVSLVENQYSLLFLRSGPGSTYHLADPFVASMPVTSHPAAGSGTPAGPQLAIEQELTASLQDPDREVVVTALKQLGNLGHVSSFEPLRAMAAGSDTEYRIRAVTALIRLGDLTVLPPAMALFSRAPANEQEARLREAVAQAIGDIRDPQAVPALAGALSAEEASLRRNAARALRGIRDSRSAAALVPALDDSDPDVRYDALLGIAEAEGAAPEMAPARDLFDENQALYLRQMKAWMRSRHPQQ